MGSALNQLTSRALRAPLVAFRTELVALFNSIDEDELSGFLHGCDREQLLAIYDVSGLGDDDQVDVQVLPCRQCLGMDCDCPVTPDRILAVARDDAPCLDWPPWAQAELLFLLFPEEYGAPGPDGSFRRNPLEPTEGSLVARTDAKVAVMADRHQSGHALYHPEDLMRRGADLPDRLAREIHTLRNGHPVLDRLDFEQTIHDDRERANG